MKITVTGERTGTNYNQETSDWINEPVTIRIDITDKIDDNNIYVGIKEDSFKINGEKSSLNKKGTKPSTYSYELTGQTNKIINNKYEVCDKLGNCERQRVSLKIDSEPPTCTIIGDGKWNPAGARVYMECEDPVISGVSYCGGATGSYYSTNIKENVRWSVEDKAGNTNECSYNVESTTQYYQVTCGKYNSCRDSSCPTETYSESSHTAQSCQEAGGSFSQDNSWTHNGTGNCSFTRHSSCEAEGCGCHNWNSNGTWKFSYCDSNSCHVKDQRLVYR